MAEVNWGLLEKSQVDNETIEEAIDRLITAHNDDADAHIGAGKSLDTHKTQETVDHPADSIVEDKIKDSNVEVRTLKWDKFILDFPFTTLDGWTENHLDTGAVTLHIGSTRLETGANNGSRGQIYAEAFAEGWAVNYSKNPRFITSIFTYGGADRIAYFVAGGNDFAAFGFKQVDDELFAYHKKDAVVTTTKVADIPGAYTQYRLKAIYTTGSKIEFYVDDVLQATHTTDLPEDSGDAADELVWALFEITNQAAANKTIYLRHMAITQDT